MLASSFVAGLAVKPVYVLHGADAFLRDTHRREIIDALIGDADPQTCVTSFDATAELAEVLDELRTLPFLAPHRVVIVRDADAFVSANREALEQYLQSPVETSSLVLTVLSWPKTTRISKIVAKIGSVFQCAAPKYRQLNQWLAQAAAQRGKEIAPDAGQLLNEWIGEDLASLDSEIEKLSLFVGERRLITAADVAEVVTATAGPAAFALTNALTAGNAPAALKALSGMLTVRGEEFRVTGMIRWHLRKVLRGCQLAAAGDRPERALSPKIPPPQRNAFLSLMKRRSLRAVQGDFRNLIRTDLGMKSGTPPLAALQELVILLCS